MSRLIIAIVSTVAEEAAIAAIGLWWLPRESIKIPPWVVVLSMVLWAVYSVITYRMGSRALKKKPLAGLSDMIGSRGVVSSSLAPEGMVNIKGELWTAKSISGEVKCGEKIVVIGQDGLKLTVRKGN